VTNGERLAAELRRAWNGAPWHGPSASEVLARLSARDAAHRHVRSSHTPWELLLHLTTWVETPLRRVDEPSYHPPDAIDFPRPAATTDAQWQRDVAALGEAVEKLALRVGRMSDEELEAPVADRGYSYMRMVDGVTQHLAYHAGQIALLALRMETAGVLAPPPTIVIAAMLSAEGLRLVRPWPLLVPRWVAYAPLWAGLGLVCWALWRFIAARTPAEPWHPSRVIVADGPFRFTRNPMYVSLLLLQLGIGIWRQSAWYLAMLVPAWYVLHRFVVLREERYLLKQFGAPYQQLLDRTPRWL